MAVYGGPDIVTDGLVLHLDAGNSKSYPGSGNTWYDLSENNNHFILHNGAYWSNSSINFDGVDDNIGRSATSSLQLKGNKTLEFWFNHNSTCGDYQGTLIRAGLGADAIYYLSSNMNNKLAFQWYNNGFLTVYSSSTYSLNTFNHGCFVMEELSGTFYINGNFAGSATVSTPSPASASLIGIGATRSGASVGTTAQDLCGQIAISKVYNIPLSHNQINQNYLALKGRFGL